MKNQVSLAMIVKNEAKTIRRTLDSVEKFVSEWIIGIDDSCSDGTDRIIKRFFKKRKLKGEIFYFRWNGSFSDARNKTLKKCNSKFILILDGHEYFSEEDQPKLNKIFDKVLSHIKCIYLYLLNLETGTLISQLRIFQNGLDAHYIGKVHNYLHIPDVNSIDEGTLIQGITLVHDRAKEQIGPRAEIREDMIIKNMTESLESNPNDVKALFYLSRQYLIMKKFDKAIHYGTRYVELCQEPYSKAVALSNLGVCYLGLKDRKKGLEKVREAMIVFPDYPYPYVLLAQDAMDRRKLDEAEKYVEASMSRNKLPMTFIPVPIAFYTWYPYFCMALVKAQKADWDAALVNVIKAKEYSKIFVRDESKMLDTLEERIIKDKQKKPVKLERSRVCINAFFVDEWAEEAIWC